MGGKPGAAPSPASPRRTRRTAAPSDLAARAAAALVTDLPTRRWFGGKARSIAAVVPLDQAAVPGSPGILGLFEVAYADGGRETYAVPVLPDPGDAGVRDAMEDPAFCGAVLEQFRRGASLPGQAGRFRFAATPVTAEVLSGATEPVACMPAEQSNTSVIYGRQATLKLYRKLEPGPNPEFEVTDFLTRMTSFRGVPRLAGAIAYEQGGGESVTVAILQEYVSNQGDAWTVALRHLAEYFTAAQEALESGEPGGEAFARTLADADAEDARHLGVVTARLHTALASATDPALAPEAIGPADVAAWREGMQTHLDLAMRTLASLRETLPRPARDPAHQVLESAPLLRERLEGIGALEAEGPAKIRVHGDFHLGQVLRVGDGFVILDFEGEPARPLAERRAKQCALKDVAGMLRSFAYAARSALAAAGGSADAAAIERLAPWAEHWEHTVQAAFLEGYLSETGTGGARFVPADRDRLDAALGAFVLDKAIYELLYEINHRPAWARIPLEGLRRAAATTRKPAPALLRPGAGPFGFVACLELKEFVGLRAENERQLADLMDEVSLDSIYYHTHGFFLRHKFVAGAYPNDFATWAAVQVRDRVLGERLAMVDPANFQDLQALREELISVIDDHLRGLRFVPGVLFGEPFEFIQSRIVEVPTGIHVRTLKEFREALLDVDVSAIYFHLVEARMRLGRGQNDFAAWLEHGLDLPDLAAKVRAVDPYTGSLERARTRLIQLCDAALAAGVG